MDLYPLWLSVRVAVAATGLALALGLAIAYLLANWNFRGKELVDALVTLPLALPPTVLGFYLLVLMGRASPIGRVWESLFGSSLVFTVKAAIIAAVLHAAPLLIKAARAAFESVDHTYERAARTLGASEWRLFWQVTLPLARRQILAAAALAFARSLGDFGITLMVAGNIPGRTQTLALAIYDAVESGDSARAGWLSLIVSVVALTAVFIMNRFNARLDMVPASREKAPA
jgi:molybdate transport system permease protein